jgi:hypothetical protein
MSAAAKSVYYFSFYLFITGLTLIFIPNVFLSTLQLPETNEIWIRVVGVLVICIGYYYFRMSAAGNAMFLKFTVQARIFVFICFAAFVLLKLAPTILIAFGGFDLLCAAWTWSALKKEKA